MVVPFVVGDCRDKLIKASQVEFMIDMGYLSDENAFSWKDFKETLSSQGIENAL